MYDLNIAKPELAPSSEENCQAYCEEEKRAKLLLMLFDVVTLRWPLNGLKRELPGPSCRSSLHRFTIITASRKIRMIYYHFSRRCTHYSTRVIMKKIIAQAALKIQLII